MVKEPDPRPTLAEPMVVASLLNVIVPVPSDGVRTAENWTDPLWTDGFELDVRITDGCPFVIV